MGSRRNTRWSRNRSHPTPNTSEVTHKVASGPEADSLVCYVLRHHKKNRTYCGMTNNIKRRLRQHNGEISGGARYTTSHGPGWVIHFVVRGFIDRRDCLRFEWRMKHTNVGQNHRFMNPCARREYIMHKLLGVWPRTLTVHHSLLCNMPVPTPGNTGTTVHASDCEIIHPNPMGFGYGVTEEEGITRLHTGLHGEDIPLLASTECADVPMDNPPATQPLLPASVDYSGLKMTGECEDDPAPLPIPRKTNCNNNTVNEIG